MAQGCPVLRSQLVDALRVFRVAVSLREQQRQRQQQQRFEHEQLAAP